MTWLIVAVAGAIGASARYAIGASIGARLFPWATLGINVSGSFLLTFLIAGPLAERMSTAAAIAVTVGFLGAFTTFSTFGYETVTLARDGRWTTAVVYVIASVIVGLGAAALGYWLGRLFSN